MGLDDIYARGILRHRDFFAAWVPGSRFDIGDWTEGLDGKKFVDKGGNIRDLGINYNLTTPQELGAIEWYSDSDVEVQSTLAATAANGLPAAAEINLQFKTRHALYVRAGGVQCQAMDNLHDVGDQLVELYKKAGDEWRRSYRVITQVLRAQCLLVIISKSSSSTAKITASAPVPVAGTSAANINFTNLVTTSANAIDKYEGMPGATPFLRLGRVKDGLFTKADFDTE